MNIQINTQANPKQMGCDLYKQHLEEITSKILKILPKARIFQPDCDIDTLNNQTIIVQDTFSFGTGGHMRAITMLLGKWLFTSRKRNITFILLEPNSKHNWILDKVSQITFYNIDDFIALLAVASSKEGNNDRPYI